MPDAKGRRNRRDRERERRRLREPRGPLTDEEREERDMREALDTSSRAATASRRLPEPMELPNLKVRFTGALVGIFTVLGAAYMVIAGTLNGSGLDSIISIAAGVIMLGVGTFVVALVLFPQQIRDFVRGDR